MGEIPTHNPEGISVTNHRAVGKKGGGHRNINAPNVYQGLFSGIMKNRLVAALAATKGIDGGQKCNIPGVSGCEDNISLLRGAIYDFRKAADLKNARYKAPLEDHLRPIRCSNRRSFSR